MRRTNTHPQAFPITVTMRHGSMQGTAKIYKLRNRDHTLYCATYVGSEGRKRDNFADLDKAQRQAEKVALSLPKRDWEAWKLTGEHNHRYVDVEPALSGREVFLTIAAKDFARSLNFGSQPRIVEACRYYRQIPVCQTCRSQTVQENHGS